MVSGPISPQGRFWGPKASISPKITYFHEWVNFTQNASFTTLHNFGEKRLKMARRICLATFESLKTWPKLTFWALGPPRCAFALKSCLFAKKRILLQSHFLAKKWLWRPKGDFGWFGWKFNQFGVGIHMVSCILRILGFLWCKKCGILWNFIIST